MNKSQLKAFHAVASLGGFTAAARGTGLSQPALTVQVKALERTYGVQLFHRTGRSVALTETGQSLYQYSQRIFALESEAEDFLNSVGGFVQGEVKIAADNPYQLMSILSEVRAKLPRLEVKVAIGNSASVVDALDQYEADLGVLALSRVDKRFDVLREHRDPIVLLVPADHGWAASSSVHVRELKDAPMIVREAGSSTRRLVEAALARLRIKPATTLELGSREAVREAVANGLGVSAMQASEVGADARVSAVALGGIELTVGEYLVCLKERRDTPLIRRLASILSRCAGGRVC